MHVQFYGAWDVMHEIFGVRDGMCNPGPRRGRGRKNGGDNSKMYGEIRTVPSGDLERILGMDTRLVHLRVNYWNWRYLLAGAASPQFLDVAHLCELYWNSCNWR